MYLKVLVGGLILLAAVFAAAFAPLITPYPPMQGDLNQALQPPSREHLLGTDHLGRDQLSRVLAGSRISLSIIAVAVGAALIVGGALGVAAGYWGGILDALIMRLVDILMAFPGFLLAIAIVSALGPGLVNLTISVAIFSVPMFARITRNTTQALKERDYVEAARAVGVSDLKIIWDHILPNSLAPILVIVTLRLAGSLLTASALSFLGLGAEPKIPEWGAMLSVARQYFLNTPHLIFGPGLAVMLMVLAFNFLGDGLRDQLDPRMKDRI